MPSPRQVAAAAESGTVQSPVEGGEWIAAVDRVDDLAAALVLAIDGEDWFVDVQILAKAYRTWSCEAGVGTHGGAWGLTLRRPGEALSVLASGSVPGARPGTSVVVVAGLAPSGTQRLRVEAAAGEVHHARTFSPFNQFVCVAESRDGIRVVAIGAEGELMGEVTMNPGCTD